MKQGGYSFVIKSTPRRLLDPQDSMDYVGGEAIYDRMIKHGWLKPAIKGNRLTRFDVRALDAACDRLEREELPL